VTQAHDDQHVDPGLAQARTDLSWTRTAIAFAALGGAVLKVRAYPGIAILVLSALIWGVGRLARSAAGPRARSRRLLLIAVTITAASLAALVISLLSSGPGLSP
jgi:uncharacterized membrane protein YidH (DUF202 family)